jgi:N-acetylglucosamine transport system permease protein
VSVGTSQRSGRWLLIVTFLLPAAALYGLFVVSPYLQAFQIAATDWGGLTPDYDFIGLANARQLLTDRYVWNALRHNAILLVLLPLITIAMGLVLASMLSVGGRRDRAGVHGVRGSALYRVVYFFPQVLSVAIIGVLWKEMYAPNSGLINGALRALGLGSLAKPWLGDPRLAFWCVLAVLVWSNVGFYVVLFGAAMQSIPRDIYEAALLDGASRVHSFFRVTLPLLRDTVSVAWVYLGFISLDMFALVFIMTPSSGGPNHASEIFASVMTFTAFQKGQFGYACAMGVALAIFSILLAAVQLRVTRRARIEF